MFLDIFKKRLGKSVRQTGILFKGIQPPDAVEGINPRISGPDVNPSGDWKKYLPTTEAQSIPFTFDTLSCTTFSSLNVIETLLNYLIEQNMLSDFHIKFLKNNGYFDKKGSINFSDRFTAIMSKTTKMGNDHISVLTCARNVGLIPDQDFPFGGKTWEEYHNKTLITQDMLDKASRFKALFEILFEWVFVTQRSTNAKELKEYYTPSLKKSPLAIAIKYPATHAVTMYSSASKAKIFDQYEPYTYSYKTSDAIHYGIRIAVNPRSVYQYPQYHFNVLSIPYGGSGVNVTAMQQVLCADGFLEEKYITGNFLSKTLAALVQWQQHYGLLPDGKPGKITINKFNELCLKKN